MTIGNALRWTSVVGICVVALASCEDPDRHGVDKAAGSGGHAQTLPQTTPQQTLRKWFVSLRDNDHKAFRECYGYYPAEYDSLILDLQRGLRNNAEIQSEMTKRFGIEGLDEFDQSAEMPPVRVQLTEDWYASLTVKMISFYTAEKVMEPRGSVRDPEGRVKTWLIEKGGVWYMWLGEYSLGKISRIMAEFLVRQERVLQALRGGNPKTPEELAGVWNRPVEVAEP